MQDPLCYKWLPTREIRNLLAAPRKHSRKSDPFLLRLRNRRDHADISCRLVNKQRSFQKLTQITELEAVGKT